MATTRSSRIVGALVGQTRDRYQPVLALGPDALVEGRAQSAAIALHDAGAAKVAVVVLGRHFDRSFGSGEAYYQQAKSRKFSWDSCCVEMEEQQA